MNGWPRAAVAGLIAIAGLARPAMAADVYVSYMALPYFEIVDLAGGRLGPVSRYSRLTTAAFTVRWGIIL